MIESDLFSATLVLLILLDPLGNMPFVLSLLKPIPKARHPKIIVRECTIAAFLMLTFLFLGEKLLKVMNLSEPALEIAGGLILFLIALRMVFPDRDPLLQEAPALATEPFIVPLAIPMLAGPSALATVILASRQDAKSITWVAAILLASLINLLLLLASRWFAKLFGKIGLDALERLMGLLLTTMAVQMLIGGIRLAFYR